MQALAAGDDAAAAQANLWWARVHSRQNNYDRAAEILEPATAKFQKSPHIDDLNFDLANALMNRKAPDWKKAGEVLQRIENNKQFGQMAEVLLLRSICFHKLADYANSLRYNDAFLQGFPEDEFAGDVRFMKAENLFLLNRADDAAAAYADFHRQGQGARQADGRGVPDRADFPRQGRVGKSPRQRTPAARKETRGNPLRPAFLRGRRLPVPPGKMGGVDRAAGGFRRELCWCRIGSEKEARCHRRTESGYRADAACGRPCARGEHGEGAGKSNTSSPTSTPSRPRSCRSRWRSRGGWPSRRETSSSRDKRWNGSSPRPRKTRNHSSRMRPASSRRRPTIWRGWRPAKTNMKKRRSVSPRCRTPTNWPPTRACSKGSP